MSTAAEVLLIVVSATLSVFLIVFIVALGYVIKVMRRVKKMAERAEHVADAVEAAADSVRHTAAPIAAVRLIAKIISKANRRKG